MDRSAARPFAKPWRMEQSGESFQIVDAAGTMLAYIYFAEDPGRAHIARRLSKDAARQMAEQILRLPELVAIEREYKNQP